MLRLCLLSGVRLDRQAQRPFLVRGKDHVVGGCELQLSSTPPGLHDAVRRMPSAEQSVPNFVCDGPAQHLVPDVFRRGREVQQRLRLHSGKIANGEAGGVR